MFFGTVLGIKMRHNKSPTWAVFVLKYTDVTKNIWENMHSRTEVTTAALGKGAPHACYSAGTLQALHPIKKLRIPLKMMVFI